MASSSPPFQTPSKRKRGQETPLTPLKFTFSLSQEDAVEDGGNSPRTAVAHRFKGLDLQSGGGGGVAGDDADVADELLPKRQKPNDPMTDVSDAAVVFGGPGPETIADDERLGAACRLPESPTKTAAGTTSLLQDVARQDAHDSAGDGDDGGEPHIVDPVRAALTWHEDEITIYDPDDKDDDGVGINGIGFRPTPAIAHARSLRRRQQITEYRKREESEARARRNQRRREGEAPAGIGKASPRKVRFSDSELRNMVVTI
ncbi:hypothetical protein CCM_01021 [Cordyceps militaris CM01]|uniref:Uncharacterized protein n=1 Tax=Cordyceps militaris (strain CM01) TaxID=983644 RepID=G3J7V1_CORMM|nr:uncharacterized protein CCM_01021 [Cordyceps militaris CM01]EGX96365.1 hypothetical protein CCM_01021 [Cordyceps militaris CM01]